MSTQQLRYFSMFSGVGGFELGIQRAFDNEHARIGAEPEQEERSQRRERPIDSTVQFQPRNRTAPLCVGYSEIDKYAIATYEHNWKGHRNYGDATAINPSDLPDFDLLVGGFPCQAFSIAGKRHGFNDTRGTLFFDIARILSHKRPRHLVLENVKGLLSHDSGKTFTTILGVLTDLGYHVEWQVLNAKDFGVPQNRERIFIVGHLGNGCGGQVFPVAGSNRNPDEGNTERENAACVDTKGGHNLRGTFIRPNKSGLQQIRDFAHNPDSRGGQTYPADTRIRRLTPKECERLMSWPDNWTIGSDTQRYKQCGNGVVSNCVQAVMEKLFSESAEKGTE